MSVFPLGGVSFSLLTAFRSGFRFLRLPYRCWLIRPSRSVVPFEAALWWYVPRHSSCFQGGPFFSDSLCGCWWTLCWWEMSMVEEGWWVTSLHVGIHWGEVALWPLLLLSANHECFLAVFVCFCRWPVWLDVVGVASYTFRRTFLLCFWLWFWQVGLWLRDAGCLHWYFSLLQWSILTLSSWRWLRAV